VKIWSLNHDRYSNPRDFDPLRQNPALTLTENNAINQDSVRRLHFTFGAGRRVCPGFHVAQRNLFLAISRMLWAFNIERQRDVYGRETPIDRDAIAPENGLIVRPADFE
jgi:cytochrome P450